MVISLEIVDIGRISIFDLNMCIYIYRFRSISKAADTLHISQPALSRRLVSLEGLLNTKLFIRGKSTSVIPTQEGTVFCKEAEKIVEDISNLVWKTKEFTHSARSLVISTLPSVRPEIVITPFSQVYQQRNPGKAVRLQRESPNMAQQHLNDGTLNLYFCPSQLLYHFNLDEYDCIQARSFAVYVGMSKENRKFNRNHISIQELRDASFVTSTKDHHIAQVKKVCADAGFIPNIAFQSRSQATVFRCVSGDEVFLTDACNINYQPETMKYCRLEDYRISYSFFVSKKDTVIDKNEVVSILNELFPSL